MSPAVNDLAGEGANVLTSDMGQTVRSPGGKAPIPQAGVTPDGTEWTCALIVLGALAFLALLEAGGFKTMLAASITTGRG